MIVKILVPFWPFPRRFHAFSTKSQFVKFRQRVSPIRDTLVLGRTVSSKSPSPHDFVALRLPHRPRPGSTLSRRRAPAKAQIKIWEHVRPKSRPTPPLTSSPSLPRARWSPQFPPPRLPSGCPTRRPSPNLRMWSSRRTTRVRRPQQPSWPRRMRWRFA